MRAALRLLTVLVLGLGLAGPAGAAIPPKAPVKAFAAIPQVQSPALSPNGDRVAALVNANGKQLLTMYALFNPKDQRTIALGDAEVLSWAWVNNDWIIGTFVIEDKSLGVPIKISRLVGLSMNGKTVPRTRIFERPIWLASDGSPLVKFVSSPSIFDEDQEILTWDLEQNKVVAKEHSYRDVGYWWADKSGAVRVGGANRNLYYRRSADSKFTRITLKNLEDYDIVGYGANDTLLILSEHEGWNALYEFDVVKNTVGRKVFGADGVELADIAHFASSDDLAGVVMLTDYPSVHWLDSGFADAQALIDKAVAPRKATILDWSTDHKKLLVNVGADRGYGSIYYFNVAEGVMQRLARNDDALGGIALADTTAISYRARDGLQVSAYLTLPVGRPGKNLPLVVMPHGGPELRDHLGYDDWTQFLANRGYAVLRPNYRGSSGLGKAFREKGAGQYGLGMQDDVTDGVHWAIAEGIADPKRICIMGGSYGGYAALWGPIRDPDLYRCAISYAGISDVKKMRSYDRDYLNPKRSRELYARLAQPDLDAISPARYFEALKTPTLIAHGKKDQRVPFAQSRDYAAVLTKAGKTVQYLELPEADHHLSREADRVSFLEAVDSFLAKYNPAD